MLNARIVRVSIITLWVALVIGITRPVWAPEAAHKAPLTTDGGWQQQNTAGQRKCVLDAMLAATEFKDVEPEHLNQLYGMCLYQRKLSI